MPVCGDRERVAGKEVLALADTDNQRTAQPRADDLAGAFRADHTQSVRSFQSRQGALNGGEQVAIATEAKLMRDEMSNDLGVGLALKRVAERFQLTT